MILYDNTVRSLNQLPAAAGAVGAVARMAHDISDIDVLDSFFPGDLSRRLKGPDGRERKMGQLIRWGKTGKMFRGTL